MPPLRRDHFEGGRNGVHVLAATEHRDAQTGLQSIKGLSYERTVIVNEVISWVSLSYMQQVARRSAQDVL